MAGPQCLVAVVAAALLAPPLHAQEDHGHSPPSYTADEIRVLGEVVQVDPAARSITLKHGPLHTLALPAGTAHFQAMDPSALEGLNLGERVHFEADVLSGVLTVTRIERVVARDPVLR
jgi:Cu(I)/Ag(I) efflux system periplasmic protein CusF